MYYVYIIGTIAITILLISLAYFVPMYLIIEFDKMTYIKNYKENMKKYKWPIYILREVLTFGTLIFSLIIIIFYLFAKPYEKKQYKEVFRSMFVTPLVGIGLSFIISCIIYAILYKLECYLIIGYFTVISILLLCIIIPYYIVLIIKQLVRIVKVENIKLKEYTEYKELGDKKSQWVKRILQSGREKEYVDGYLQLYETEEEWEENEYTKINYKYYYNLIIVIFIIGMVGNFILSSVENEIFKMNVETALMYYVAMTIILIVFLNWIFNSKILINIKSKEKITIKMKIKLVVLIIIGIVLTMLLWNYAFGGLSIDSDGYNYQNTKEDVEYTVDKKRDYLNYNEYEKMQYTLGYIQYFMDDIDELGYYYYDNFILAPVENQELLEYCQSLNKYNGDCYVSISRSNMSIRLTSEMYEDDDKTTIFYSSYEDLYRYDSEEKKEQYESENEHYRYGYLSNNDLEKLIKEDAVRAIDSLWNEEMKDRGLIQ